ncbi:MAG: ATP-binding protein [Alphaproteobacteria bacterium]|nr:ATP-binding protein [Alphaproteobacteria bacterium]
MVDSVTVLAQAELIAHHIDLKPSIPPNLPTVAASKIELEQVLLNLVRNSIEAMQEGRDGGRILKIAATCKSGNEVRVDIVDSGPGLDPSIEDKIFEPFATTKSDGLGMGIAISRRIVEGAGGRLWIAKSGPDGLQVSLTLPVAGAI